MACGNPEDVKVRRRDTKEVIPKTGGPQKYKSYDKTMGFQCYNKDQVDGQCLDYEISLCCPAGKKYCFCKILLCKKVFFLFEGKIRGVNTLSKLKLKSKLRKQTIFRSSFIINTLSKPEFLVN